MMRVPDSREAPDLRARETTHLLHLAGMGPHTAFMSDHEIEQGFRERFQHRDDDERQPQPQSLYEQTGRALDSTQGVCMVLAAIPREPVMGLPGLSEAEAQRFTNPQLCPELVYSNARALLKWEGGRLRKSLRKWIVREYDSTRFPSRRFLSDDGTVASSYRLGIASERSEQSHYFPFGQPNHCISAHVESAVIDFVSLLRTYAAQRQVNGGYRIRAGLVSKSEDAIYIRRTEGI